MAIKTVRIGSLKDIHRYDDGDFTGGLETDDDIYCEAVNCTDLENTGDINIATGKSYKVNSIGVVTDQQAAVANATGAGDVVLRLNELLARLRSHGLIA